MPLSPEQMQFAIDDARRRHAAVVDLIMANDRQALGFLQLYVALAGGAFSGAAAILFAATTAFPRALGYGLLGFGLPLAVGAVLALIAMQQSDINLAGRKPDFWLWAHQEPTEPAHVFKAYMTNLAEKEAQNSRLNLRLSGILNLAKIAGAAAPFAGLAAGIAARLAGA